MKRIVLFSTIVFLSACAATKLLTPTQSDVDRVQSKYSDYSLAELQEGKLLFEQHCGNCHGLKKPSSRTEEQWSHIVPEMAGKAEKKKGDIIDVKSQEAILKYLITMSSAPAQISK